MTEPAPTDTKINISEIVGSLIDDTSTHQESSSSDDTSSTKSIIEQPSVEPISSPEVAETYQQPNKKEHAKLYQREYRKRQKMEKELLRETQVKGSEILMVFTNGQIVSRDLRNEDDYIEMLTDFSESLKKQGSLLSFRITQRNI